MVNVSNHHIRVYCKFSLEVDGQGYPYGGSGAYIEDVKDPTEV